jgi:hypothetical protein
MGCDIHWIIERKHSDGDWEAVASKAYTYEVLWETSASNYHLPVFSFGSRDYQLFGILSGVRCDIPNQSEYLAGTNELPGDASEHSLLSQPLDDPDLHSHGWFTLGQIRAAVAEDAPGCAPGEEDKTCLADRLAILEAMIEGPNAIDLTQILIGPAYDYDNDDGGSFPMMRNISNHTNLAHKARAEKFLPIGDDTLRVLICYDN